MQEQKVQQSYIRAQKTQDHRMKQMKQKKKKKHQEYHMNHGNFTKRRG